MGTDMGADTGAYDGQVAFAAEEMREPLIGARS